MKPLERAALALALFLGGYAVLHLVTDSSPAEIATGARGDDGVRALVPPRVDLLVDDDGGCGAPTPAPVIPPVGDD